MKSFKKIEEIWNPYNSLMLNERNKDLCLKAYSRLPFHVKKKIFRHKLIICDYAYHSKYPEKTIEGMPYGFYHEGKSLIDIVPEEANKLSDKAFIGFIVHETAHFSADKTIKPIKILNKWRFKHRFNSLSQTQQKFYGEPEEVHVDKLAIKWGFKEEIELLNKERVIIL